jgi:hypothetical protein
VGIHYLGECTLLNLLTRDGAVAVRFKPPLDEPHYAELYELSCDAASAEELRAAVKEAAVRWGRMVEVD